MITRIVDPPGGWRYGFPKPCSDEVWHDHEKFKDFLSEAGYPERDLEFASENVRVGFGEKEDA